MTILPANDVLIYSDTLGDNRAADMTVAYPPANLMTDGPDGNPRFAGACLRKLEYPMSLIGTLDKLKYTNKHWKHK